MRCCPTDHGFEDLDAEIDGADADHDLERATAARVEREALLDELRRATGHHGQIRRLGDDSERVRKMVRARVHRALLLIADHHPQLAQHLRESIETGSSCVYRPAEVLVWTDRHLAATGGLPRGRSMDSPEPVRRLRRSGRCRQDQCRTQSTASSAAGS